MRPLHLAAYFNQPEVARILINADADVNAKDNRGKTMHKIHWGVILLDFFNFENFGPPPPFPRFEL